MDEEIKKPRRSYPDPLPGTRSGDLYHRILWILENRDMTHEQLAINGGFVSMSYPGEVNRSSVSAIFTKLRKDPNHPLHISLDTYERIAKGGRVSVIWLMHGVGEPGDMNLIFDERKYPNLARAIEFYGPRWSQHTINALTPILGDKDYEPHVWVERLDQLEAKFMMTQNKNNTPSKSRWRLTDK